MKESLNEKKGKKTIFNKIINFVNGFSKNRKIYDEEIRLSKFDDFLLEVDKKSDIYFIVKNVISLCDNAIIIARHRLMIINKLQMLNEEINELQCYQNLSEEDMLEFKELISRFISLNNDKNALRYQIIGFDKGLLEMEKLEVDAKFVLGNVEDAEKNKRILNHDLGYLRGEKLDLEYQREVLINVKNILYKFSIFIVLFFTLVFVFLAFLRIFKYVSILFPISILCILIIVIIVGVYILKVKIKKELTINLKKQHKTVELINKKNVVYAYYSNFLDYVYKKYNVKNSDKLKQNIKEYGNYKHIVTRFDAIRDSLYNTEKEIEEFLRKNNIENSVVTIERFAKTVNIEDKRKYYKNLSLEKDRLEKKLCELDKKHEEIWNELVVLNNLDKTSDKIIDRIIKRYIEEVGKLVNIKFEFIDEEEIKKFEEEINKILGDDKMDKKIKEIDNENNIDYNISE